MDGTENQRIDRAVRSRMDRAIISRRKLLGGALGVSVMTLLAACGSDNDEPDPTTEGASASPTTAPDQSTGNEADRDAASDTRTVEHAMGVTEVPAEPQRVIVLDQGEMDMAVALGVQPIGAALYTVDQEFADYLQDIIGDYTRVGTVDEPDLEAIVNLNPDLIISNMTRHEAIYDTLAEIAPTVFAEALGADWKASFEVVARALGREEQHREVMGNYEGRLDEFKEAMGDRLDNTHVTIVRSFPDHIRLYMKASFIGVIIEDSGLPRPAPQDKDIFMEEISAERIRDLAADVIFTLYYNPSQGEQLSTLTENPLWDQLAAVQAGQVYEMSDEVWGTGLGPLAAMEVINDLFDIFVEGEIQDVYEPEESSASGFPVTVEHKFGSTEIPGAPERVIALGFNEQDAILAVGVKPIAVRYWFGEEPNAVFPWAQDELGDAEPEVLNMTWGELDFEAIAALQPDLISGVYAGITQEEYDTLSRIAPTITQPAEFIDFGTPWQDMTRLVGQALGRSKQAQDLVATVEAQFDEARQAHPDWTGKRVVVGAPRGDGQFGFVASEDPRTRVFTSLGFEASTELDEIAGDLYYGSLSLERADLLDVDLLVFHQMAWVEGGREAIESDPLLSQLTVLREGRALFIEDELDDALQFGTVLSLPYLLDSLVPMIEAAMDDETEANG